MRKFTVAAVIMLITLAAYAQQTATKTFYVNDPKKKDVVTFTSKATLETIVGQTAEVRGFITVDPADIAGTAKCKIEVALDSLRSGISMRDKDMKNDFLETSKFPLTTFELTKVVSSSQNTLEDKKEVQISAEGNYTVHGVTKPITVTATLLYLKESDETKTRLPGDLLHVTANFEVPLSDYGIKRPQFLLLKLEEKQRISVDIIGSTGLPAVTLNSK